ncbi:MAG: heme exporter protein CcmD [Pseudomonadota bacterium]
MIPDLGAYAFEVSLAYAGSIALLVGFIWICWRQARASQQRLDDAEGRSDG